ncbi:hypothetical protein YC2023_080854 [Brassica napus]
MNCDSESDETNYVPSSVKRFRHWLPPTAEIPKLPLLSPVRFTRHQARFIYSQRSKL